jgi:RND family efflux transporter MFP subunit
MIQRGRELIHSPGLAGGLALWVVAGISAGCAPGDVAEAPPVVRPIKMMEIGEAVSALRREYPGRIAPAVEAELGFEVAGRIVSFPVSEGERVRKGQVLARLDPSDYEAQLAAARADLKAAEADYERFRELLEKNAVSVRDFQTRERNFEVAQARLQIAEKALADTRLSAHFQGRVARKLVDDFQNVQAKQPVLLLQDESRLEIKIDVPEADIALGDPDRKSEYRPLVTVTAFPGRSFPAQIAEISTAADPVTRTFEATLAFAPDEDVRVLPGMTAQISIAIERVGADSPGHAIPSRCVATGDDGDAYVWKVNPETLEVSRAAVEVGELTGANILVRSGLSQGDLIAVSGVHHLREGMTVRRMEGASRPLP